MDAGPAEVRATRVASLRAELLRKGLHIAFGCGALLLRWLEVGQASLLALLALLFNLFVLHRVTGGALLREDERRRGFSWGVALYPGVVLALILIFHNRLELAAGVWALVGFGDGMATVGGLLLGGPRLPWNRAKSWAGFLAFVLYGTVTSAFLIRWTQRAWVDAAAREPAVGGAFLDAGSLGGAGFLLMACLAASLAAALAESIETGLDDNLLVPLAGGSVLVAGTFVEPERLAAALPEIAGALAVAIPLVALLAVAARIAGGVNTAGALAGWILGTTLFALAGWRGFLVLALFFALGTATTRLGYARKAARGLAQPAGGRRGPGHALANGTAGVLLAFLATSSSFPMLCAIAMVASFATAACDTVSSEVGQAYGKRHYRLAPAARVPAGTPGAVSLVGTLAGLAGGAFVATAAWAVGLLDPRGAAIVTVAAFSGTLIESGLGTAVERFELTDGGWINFANTCAGALVAGGLHLFVPR